MIYFGCPASITPLVAYVTASIDSFGSRLTKRRGTIEGGELLPEAGQQKDLPAILVLSATTVLPPRLLTRAAHFRKN